jgi:hypothetical protein
MFFFNRLFGTWVAAQVMGLVKWSNLNRTPHGFSTAMQLKGWDVMIGNGLWL